MKLMEDRDSERVTARISDSDSDWEHYRNLINECTEEEEKKKKRKI